MRHILALLFLCALASPVQAQPTVAEPGWSLLQTFSFNNPVAAIVHPLDGQVYLLRRATGSSTDGVYRLESYGGERRLVSSSYPAGLVADPATGMLFFSGDYEGVVYRVDPSNPVRETWVTGWHSGDDDPAGLAIVPASYADSLVAPGDGLVVDRGNSGADEVWRWSPSSPEGETVLHADDGTLYDAFDITADDSGIFLTDTGGGSDGVIFELGPGGALIPFATSTPLPEPEGIAIDPDNGDFLVLDEGLDALVRVDRTTGTVSDVVTGLTITFGWGGVDVSPDGTLMVVTNFNADEVYLYGRCDATGQPGLDCDGNGILDQCDIAAGTLPDCNGNGVPDSCDIASGTSEDCNNDGVPDECPTCPPVELAVILDTSASMDAEGSALCSSLSSLQSRLEASGLQAQSTLFGICDQPGGAYSCLQATVVDSLGTAVPQASGNPDLATLGECPGGVEVCQEDWGRATAVVAGRFPWQPRTESVRIAMPVSDEGAWCGDASSQLDWDSIELAAAVAQDHDVFVSPITASGSSSAVIGQAQALADSTGGQTFSSSASAQDIADGVYDLVLSACNAASDCNDNGTLDSCEINAGTAVDENGDGVPDECQAPVSTRSIPGVGLGLQQNVPNPFNPSTTLHFDLPRAMEVELAIVSVDGRLVDLLHAGALPAGPHALRWDGTDSGGRAVASGIYYARLRGGEWTERVRMVLLK